MKNKILFGFLSFFLLSFTEIVNAQNATDIEVLGRVSHAGDKLQIIRSSENDVIIGMLQNKNLKQDLSKLEDGDEAILKGYLTYLPTSREGSTFHPVLMVESIRPISLKRIGKIENYGVKDRPTYSFLTQKEHYAPSGIPVTTEVASAITMTASILLFQSLTATPTDPEVSQQINTGMIFFAGAMATGVFIYEQIFEKNKGN